VYDLIKNDISAICAHTNLDKSPVFGVNTELAQSAGLENISVSDDSEFLFLGYSNSLSAAAFADILKKSTGCKTLQFTCTNNEIKKVGLCSGAGGSEIYASVKNGCDAFITGEMKHHEILFANENNVSVFILGHYRSEDIVIAPLAKKLSVHFPNVVFTKSQIFSDGVNCW
ncbi:MAG: Nif3-like dinuclear metal center hexameric protein, partial [Clostridia bacterium]|nr:Nif3-like dinuclear metal center hexameric protein [Clostridia bacterium]